MSGVNKVILVGNLGADPEVRTFQNGGKVCNLRLAVTEKWTKDCKEKGPAYTLVVDGKLIWCGGVHLMDFECGECWMLFAKNFYDHIKSGYQALKKMLHQVIGVSKV